MRKTIALLLAAVLLALTLAGCGQEKELEPWTMPAVDAKPTPEPTPTLSYGGGTPEKYVWNEAVSFRMNDPGTDPASTQETFTHAKSLTLFPYTFLPAAIFSESYAAYPKLTLKKQEHAVMLDECGALAEHAYIEYVYLPKNGTEADALYVMVELCSYDAAAEISLGGVYPHIGYEEGARPALSTYYLKNFVLARYGEQRLAQVLKLAPSSYFSDAREALREAEETGESYTPARQVFMTVTCGIHMSDEAFVAAVSNLLRYSDGSENPTPEPSRLPVFGEKGAA
ncbi:MAG: hypothetical protein IJV41_09220 [Oscillospiraceae bacterium]|nr:hypothetical protein [Oscillospiraceae bacterium]